MNNIGITIYKKIYFCFHYNNYIILCDKRFLGALRIYKNDIITIIQNQMEYIQFNRVRVDIYE